MEMHIYEPQLLCFSGHTVRLRIAFVRSRTVCMETRSCMRVYVMLGYPCIAPVHLSPLMMTERDGGE